MIIFHRYDVRTKPSDLPVLSIYAPDQEALERNETYLQLVAENRPCKFQLADTQIWYHNGKGNRSATEDEIEILTHLDRYTYDPNVKILSPAYYYPAYGDERILAPLREKLQADYEEYLADWKNAYNESRETLL